MRSSRGLFSCQRAQVAALAVFLWFGVFVSPAAGELPARDSSYEVGLGAPVISVNPAVDDLERLRFEFLNGFATESGAVRSLQGSTEERTPPSVAQQQNASLQGIVAYDCVGAERLASDFQAIGHALKDLNVKRAARADQHRSKLLPAARARIVGVAKERLEAKAEELKRTNTQIFQDLQDRRGWIGGVALLQDEVQQWTSRTAAERLAQSLELIAKTVEKCLPKDGKSGLSGRDTGLAFLRRLPGELRLCGSALMDWEGRMDRQEREEYRALEASFNDRLRKEADEVLKPVGEKLQSLRRTNAQLVREEGRRLENLEKVSRTEGLFDVKGEPRKAPNGGESRGSTKPKGPYASTAPVVSSPPTESLGNASNKSLAALGPVAEPSLDWNAAVASFGGGIVGTKGGNSTAGKSGSGSASRGMSFANASWYLKEALGLRDEEHAQNYQRTWEGRKSHEAAEERAAKEKSVHLPPKGHRNVPFSSRNFFTWQSNPDIRNYLRGPAQKKKKNRYLAALLEGDGSSAEPVGGPHGTMVLREPAGLAGERALEASRRALSRSAAAIARD